MDIGPERVLAVGDGENDICLLRAAGQSIAFRPKTAAVRNTARHVVENALADILTVLADEVRPLPLLEVDETVSPAACLLPP
jgi:phosphoserine phosphatase